VRDDGIDALVFDEHVVNPALTHRTRPTMSVFENYMGISALIERGGDIMPVFQGHLPSQFDLPTQSATDSLAPWLYPTPAGVDARQGFEFADAMSE
jgi:hypothetical protein